ncbi:hypothetical protein ALC57_10548 [Trachymyrmex cornetzi]|uniref:Reverse transcriptase/retrotransposon-derived protein RNase H-like domain-containing protein n=1 Tax=Trachymyrmex cornetzi TaxID=471704 RepID=A0A151J425_9HYME|nr:hypothetical protein ALC57_10548 [Trachymyrmex cornetzi]
MPLPTKIQSAQIVALLKCFGNDARIRIWRRRRERFEAIKEFSDLKTVLMKSPVLQFFDSNAEITLSVDSSKDGMGAVILQSQAPIAYASKSLTESLSARLCPNRKGIARDYLWMSKVSSILVWEKICSGDRS